MAQVRGHLPVYLPGNNRDWNEVPGLATISDNGEINIKLADKRMALNLAKMFQQGTLLQLAFDYQMSPEVLKQINDKHKEK